MFFLQVECKLFSEVGETLMLRTVRHNEMLVTDVVNRAREIFQRNTVGPQRSTIIQYFPVEKLQIKTESHCGLSVGWLCGVLCRYLDVYKKYTDLLDRQDILNFLKDKHSLQGFTKVAFLVRALQPYRQHKGEMLPCKARCFYRVTCRKSQVCRICGRRSHRCMRLFRCPWSVWMRWTWTEICVTRQPIS